MIPFLLVMKMKYKLSKKNVDSMIYEYIKESDSIEELIRYVEYNSIYRSKFNDCWSFYMITLYNDSRKEIVIGNNEVSRINFTGTIRSRDDHEYDYVIQTVYLDDWLEYCRGVQDVVKG